MPEKRKAGITLIPFCDGFSELPRSSKKRPYTFTLSQDVIAAIRESGAGYNARVEAVLKKAIEKGLI